MIREYKTTIDNLQIKVFYSIYKSGYSPCIDDIEIENIFINGIGTDDFSIIDKFSLQEKIYNYLYQKYIDEQISNIRK